ncbi:carbohydrate kinase family protein [Amorphus orientalis]|uniref:Fructokinase n=1 Tax=Amorphus orientalis TaxID=649198 RepID=A0AAE4AR49_9HYPH|nr:carbohydrate kinase [Amorphus orientalis]MDQ0314801.1 fructokinase [Amorphus orientalis]
MIVTCGEAVVDFLPEPDADGRPLFRPVLGGSLYNVALGLGRLGVPAAYFWELSTDPFGTWLASELEASGASLAHTTRGDRPSTLAFVDLSGDEPHFQIIDAGQTMSTLDPAGLGPLPPSARLFHTGSAILALEPGGTAIERFVHETAKTVPVSLDFNVRPPSIRDLDGYKARLDRLVGSATIVKASAADLAVLEPDMEPDAILARWRTQGVPLGIVTLGGGGAIAATADHWIRLPAETVTLKDPVGAGDAFMTGLFARLWERNALDRTALGALGEADLTDAIAYAQKVAGFVCRHAGAVFPWRADLEANDPTAAAPGD